MASIFDDIAQTADDVVMTTVKVVQENPELSGAVGGFVIGGPVGAVAGAFVGHIWRKGRDEDNPKGDGPPPEKPA